MVSESLKTKVLHHIVTIRDKKYMEKLICEMDLMINEVKKTDPRQLDGEDLFPYRMDPTLLQPKKQIRFNRYKGFEEDKDSLLKNIDYKAH